MLIHGDNLLALKALEQDYTGKIKCIYIDPPYNTGHAFEHYEDGLEHSEWLSLMKPRLEILRRLLKNDGSIWISIDDDESHYLKVLCDEVFWRKNFVSNVIWEKKYSPQNDAKWLSDSHDHILCYAKNKEIWRPYLMPRTEAANSLYKNPDKDKRWEWMSDNFSVKTFSETWNYKITLPSWRVVSPPESRAWGASEEKFKDLVKDNRIWFWKNGDGIPRIKRFLSEVKQWMVSKTIWYRTEVWDNQEAKREVKKINKIDSFATPKPERLIERILFLSTKENDLILDSFLGSWTTTAVAHKMWRKWIGIELWNHAYTHCKVRMDKVIDWNDSWWITDSVKWEWGGGYKFYELGPSLMQKDERGRFIINPDMDSELLVKALCKIENFTFLPDGENDFIRHWYSTERDFLHVTTRHVDQEMVNRIQSKYLQEDESILIFTKSFSSDLILPSNIQVKKIPNQILRKCEYGKDNYSLPALSEESDQEEETINKL